jgi:BMFP domain-containing protein YqiC
MKVMRRIGDIWKLVNYYKEDGFKLLYGILCKQKEEAFGNWCFESFNKIKQELKREKFEIIDPMVIGVINNTESLEKRLIELETFRKSHEEDKLISDEQINDIRNLIHRAKIELGVSIWHDLHKRFKFSKLARISEKKAKMIIDYLKELLPDKKKDPKDKS